MVSKFNGLSPDKWLVPAATATYDAWKKKDTQKGRQKKGKEKER